jgi:aspartate/methionine/tyrosine aminotransferase
MAQAFGLEARRYALRQENGFRIDTEEIRSLIDANTRLLLVNSPHNPTGATLSDSEMEGLHDFCAERGVQFLSDQVYHPIYHEGAMLGDFSKALCLSGLRIGWIVEPDEERRRRYLNARSYLTVCSSAMAERLAVLALRQREAIYSRARKIAGENLQRLAAFFAARRGLFHYRPPRGGMTAFPSMADGSDARPLCVHALRQGTMLAPGDCFGMPAYFRIGFAASGERFAAALEKLANVVDEFAHTAAEATATD